MQAPWILAVLGAAACGSSTTTTAPTGPVNVAGLPVEVEISSVNLADDCGGDAAGSGVAASMDMSECAEGSDCGGSWCQQTTMQLSVTAGEGDAAAQVVVTKVELLDESGQVVGTLTPRSPQRWDEAAGGYVPWDGAVAPGATFGASYELTAPDWAAIPGGRWGAGTFQARVTVSMGGAEVTRVSAATAVVPDPMVVT